MSGKLRHYPTTLRDSDVAQGWFAAALELVGELDAAALRLEAVAELVDEGNRLTAEQMMSIARRLEDTRQRQVSATDGLSATINSLAARIESQSRLIIEIENARRRQASRALHLRLRDVLFGAEYHPISLK